MKKVLLVLALFAIGAAHGAAGKAVFVSGSVTAEGPRPRTLATGAEVNVGDTIITAAKSRAQLVMNDGQRYALRAGSSFRIDAFSLPAAVSNGAQATAVAADGQSFFTLQKGGFRSVSGAIGKKDPAAYQVRTPVGTLGIRGTVWAAVFCRDDCDDAPGLAPGQPIRNGLYIGVDQGRIHFAGRGLELELNAGEYAFIPLDEVPIERLKQPPVFLLGDGAGPLEVAGNSPRTPARALNKPADFVDRRSPVPERAPADIVPLPASSDAVAQAVGAQGPRGALVDLTKGSNPPQRSLAYAYGGGQAPLVTAGSTLASVMLLDANGNLVGFATPNGSLQNYAIGSAQQAALGSNAATAIRWGRWTSGNATVTTPGVAPQTLNLAQQSLPWIVGPDLGTTVAVPVVGTRSYILAGATNPTDTRGNSGALGGAFLAADFTNRNLTATLTLDIANSNWWASGTVPIAAGSNQFAGNFSDVRINGVAGSSGALAGFLVEAQNPGPVAAGAGFGYYLTDATGQRGTVTGVVALREGQGVPPPAPPPPGNRQLGFVLASYLLGQASRPYSTAAFDATAQVVVDANGNLSQFRALDPGSQLETYGRNTSSNVNTGFDAGTGIRWGRWSGGSASLQLGAAQNLATQSLHWVLGSAYLGAPTLPNTGSGYLALVGNTTPTDTRGNAGLLGGASFQVDFTRQIFDFAVLVTIDGRSYYAANGGVFVPGSREFGAALPAVVVGNIAVVAGGYSGFIAVPGATGPVDLGAAITWYVDPQVASIGNVSGAAVFSAAGSGFPAGGGNALTPPAQQRRDIAFSIAGASSAAATANAAAEYVRSGFDLSRFRGVLAARAGLPVAAEFDIGDAATADAGFDLRGMLRWGRWAGGAGTVTTPPASGNSALINYSQQSLHYIMSADSANAPVLPATGNAAYTWIGNTNPTNQQNQAGTLNSATFAANFTNATVAASINASFANSTWSGAGNGTITGGTNLFSGNLNGTFTDTQAGFSLPASGSFNGFFTGPQDAAGIPNGVGLSFEMTEQQTQSSVNGIAAFVARP